MSRAEAHVGEVSGRGGAGVPYMADATSTLRIGVLGDKDSDESQQERHNNNNNNNNNNNARAAARRR